MKIFAKIFPLLFTVFAMLGLIIDSKTAMSGAVAGVNMCLSSVVPSLFPFITFSYILNSRLSNLSFKSCGSLFRLYRIPKGAESILILGLIGGYPVGAQAINDAYKNKYISKSQGERLLAYCSNAGPAFIFGIGSCLFQNKLALWALWLVHIISAFLVSRILPNNGSNFVTIPKTEIISLSSAVRKAMITTSAICAWVILFKVMISYVEKYIYNWATPLLCTVIAGVIELTNGFHRLTAIADEGLRFVIASAFLSFGGICVLMQTTSVTKDLGLGYYFPGKVAQFSVSFLLASFVRTVIYRNHGTEMPLIVTIIILLMFIISTIILRKQ